MKKMTEENLRAAFAGESQASVKYQLFAEVAEKAGLKKTAKLFRATAYAEQVHAKNHLRALKGIKKTVENLEAAIGGEDFEVDEMYPAYLAVAKEQDEKIAQKYFTWAMEAEKEHSRLYNIAKIAAEKDEDVDIKSVYVCPLCGHTHEGDHPEEDCPLCGLKAEKYINSLILISLNFNLILTN